MDEICDKCNLAESLSNLREQFAELIEKVKAVKMDNTWPLIQDFLAQNKSIIHFH